MRHAHKNTVNNHAKFQWDWIRIYWYTCTCMQIRSFPFWCCCDLELLSRSLVVVWIGKTQWVLPLCKVWHSSHSGFQKITRMKVFATPSWPSQHGSLQTHNFVCKLIKHTHTHTTNHYPLLPLQTHKSTCLPPTIIHASLQHASLHTLCPPIIHASLHTCCPPTIHASLHTCCPPTIHASLHTCCPPTIHASLHTCCPPTIHASLQHTSFQPYTPPSNTPPYIHASLQHTSLHTCLPPTHLLPTIHASLQHTSLHTRLPPTHLPTYMPPSNTPPYIHASLQHTSFQPYTPPSNTPPYIHAALQPYRPPSNQQASYLSLMWTGTKGKSLSPGMAAVKWEKSGGKENKSHDIKQIHSGAFNFLLFQRKLV